MRSGFSPPSRSWARRACPASVREHTILTRARLSRNWSTVRNLSPCGIGPRAELVPVRNWSPCGIGRVVIACTVPTSVRLAGSASAVRRWGVGARQRMAPCAHPACSPCMLTLQEMMNGAFCLSFCRSDAMEIERSLHRALLCSYTAGHEQMLARTAGSEPSPHPPRSPAPAHSTRPLLSGLPSHVT
jgi:hypothetical protein